MDVTNLHVCNHIAEYPAGPYGAKGAGELPLVGIPASYTEAMEVALETKIGHIPYTIEDAMKALTGGDSK